MEQIVVMQASQYRNFVTLDFYQLFRIKFMKNELLNYPYGHKNSTSTQIIHMDVQIFLVKEIDIVYIEVNKE